MITQTGDQQASRNLLHPPPVRETLRPEQNSAPKRCDVMDAIGNLYITIITKGGGKKFHGFAGWRHRHENDSAGDYFNNRNGLSRLPYRYNIAVFPLTDFLHPLVANGRAFYPALRRK